MPVGEGLGPGEASAAPGLCPLVAGARTARTLRKLAVYFPSAVQGGEL